MGLKTFIRVAEHLLFHYSPVCESPTWKEWDLMLSQLHPSYHLIVTSPLSLDIFFLVGSRVLLIATQQLVSILVLTLHSFEILFLRMILKISLTGILTGMVCKVKE